MPKSPLPYIILFVLILTAGLVWRDMTRVPGAAPAAKEFEEDIQKETVPDFTFKTLSGETGAIRDFRGKTVVMNFWASWCAPCVVEFPDLLKLATDRKDTLVLLAVSVDHDQKRANAFIEKMGDPAKAYNVVIAYDPERKITQDLFGTVLYPETWIISPDGILDRKIVGVADWSGEEMKNYLDSFSD